MRPYANNVRSYGSRGRGRETRRLARVKEAFRDAPGKLLFWSVNEPHFETCVPQPAAIVTRSSRTAVRDEAMSPTTFRDGASATSPKIV